MLFSLLTASGGLMYQPYDNMFFILLHFHHVDVVRRCQQNILSTGALSAASLEPSKCVHT